MPTWPVILDWGLSSFFGWGVNGLQTVLSWTRSGRFTPIAALPIHREHLALSPLEWLRIAPILRESDSFQERIAAHSGQNITVSVPVLHGLGNNLAGASRADGGMLSGAPTIGVCYLEQTAIDAEARAGAERYAAIVAGSSFVAQVLAAAGIDRVRTVLQGVDPTYFHPAPKAGWFRDRFVVYSGGKPELRKGQDLVLLAFRAFARRHPEALLLTTWHSPWPQFSASLAANPDVVAVPLRDDGQFDVESWAVANGLRADQVFDLGAVPNSDMPRILREADVGLFPNRGEGGTNLVAMECMACGVPAILSANTGHLDLIRDGNCLPLTRQRPVTVADGCDGWGESDLDEIVEALETLWNDRERAASIGRAGAEFLSGLTWDRYANELGDLVESCVG